jgi:drug/metabolite transporter (DMT)-like permease
MDEAIICNVSSAACEHPECEKDCPRTGEQPKKISQTEALQTKQWTLFTAIFFYFILSSSMLILNKAALLRFPFPITLAAAQAASSAGLLHLLKILGVLDYQAVSLRKLMSWKWVAVVWTVPLVCNFNALAYVSVEAMMTFRSLSTVFVAIVDHLFLNEQITRIQIFACAIISIGGILYALSDFQSSLRGWIWGISYSASTVANVVYIKHVFNLQTQMSSWEKTFLNNFASLPFLIVIALQEDISSASERIFRISSGDIFIILLSCLGGFGTTSLDEFAFSFFSMNIHF